jgi:RimJ/RimL family protein N-acetyltransferase
MENRTDRLVIRIIERRDIEDARRLHNDDTVLFQLSDATHVSEIAQEKWFQAISESRQSKRYIARLAKDDAFVGVFRLDRIDLFNKSAIVGADIVDKYRRQGIATEMFNYFISYLFEQCGFNRLALTTLEINHPARDLYKKLGFKEEGMEREAIYRNGRYQNLISMGMLAKDRSGSVDLNKLTPIDKCHGVGLKR